MVARRCSARSFFVLRSRSSFDGLRSTSTFGTERSCPADVAKILNRSVEQAFSRRRALKGTFVVYTAVAKRTPATRVTVEASCRSPGLPSGTLPTTCALFGLAGQESEVTPTRTTPTIAVAQRAEVRPQWQSSRRAATRDLPAGSGGHENNWRDPPGGRHRAGTADGRGHHRRAISARPCGVSIGDLRGARGRDHGSRRGQHGRTPRRRDGALRDDRRWHHLPLVPRRATHRRG